MRFLHYADSECLSFYGFRSARLRDFIYCTKQKSNKQTSFYRSVETSRFYVERVTFHGPKGGLFIRLLLCTNEVYSYYWNLVLTIIEAL